MSAGDRPTMATALNQSVWSILSGVHTCLPGRVEKYDVSQSLAEVKPMLRRKYVDDTVEEMPVIANVPVVWMRTSKAAIHLPLSSGDYVLLLFAERSLDAWLSEGGEVTPTDRRKFALADAIAIPGLFPFSDASPVDNNDDVTIQTENAAVRIEPDGTIHLTGKAFKLGETTKALVNDSFQSVFDNHIHNFTAAPSGVFGTSTPCRIVGTIPFASVGNPIGTFDGAMVSGNLTSKTEAE
jgi:hypothetical protein